MGQAQAVAIAPGPALKLTNRETQVIGLVAEGKSYKEMSRETGLSAGTLRAAVRMICAKLDAPNRVAAAVKYERIKAKEDEDGLVP